MLGAVIGDEADEPSVGFALSITLGHDHWLFTETAV
jgi:hypothetical protein